MNRLSYLGAAVGCRSGEGIGLAGEGHRLLFRGKGRTFGFRKLKMRKNGIVSGPIKF